MTYKRFEYISFDGFTDNGEYITPYQVVKLLNEQHEQIQFLNMKYAERTSIIGEQSLKIENLEKENEQLKKDREELFIRERNTKNEWRELKQENEQLKKELASFKPVIFESDGKPVTLYKKGDVE